jgi:hypothetical protein
MTYANEDLILSRADAIVMVVDWFVTRVPALPLETIYEVLYLSRHHPETSSPIGEYCKRDLLDSSYEVLARYLEEHPCTTPKLPGRRSTQG